MFLRPRYLNPHPQAGYTHRYECRQRMHEKSAGGVSRAAVGRRCTEGIKSAR